jgi:hypothetical protein
MPDAVLILTAYKPLDCEIAGKHLVGRLSTVKSESTKPFRDKPEGL